MPWIRSREIGMSKLDERGERCDLVIPDPDPESSYAVLHKAMPQQVRYDIADLYRF